MCYSTLKVELIDIIFRSLVCMNLDLDKAFDSTYVISKYFPLQQMVKYLNWLKLQKGLFHSDRKTFPA